MDNKEMDKFDEAYDWEDKPTGVSWVDKLKAARAVEQCRKWGLTPGLTLEDNRAILKNRIKEGTPPCSGSQEAQRVDTEDKSLMVAQPNPQWMDVVRATAEAVGTQIAAALSTQQLPATDAHPQQSLPRVLQDMAQSAPFCSGSDATELLKFLITLNQIVKLQLTNDRQVLIALLPKTRGQLRAMWTAALLTGESTTQLASQAVETFLPDRAKQQLLAQSVYRVQNRSETLTDYIMSVMDAAEVLLPPNYNLLDTVLTGINPPTRARLAGFPAPTQLSDLLHLIPRMEVVRQLEAQTNPQPSHCYNQPQRYRLSRDYPPYRGSHGYTGPRNDGHSPRPLGQSFRPHGPNEWQSRSNFQRGQIWQSPRFSPRDSTRPFRYSNDTNRLNHGRGRP